MKKNLETYQNYCSKTTPWTCYISYKDIILISWGFSHYGCFRYRE